MVRVETVRLCLWRNSCADHPVLVGTISLGDAFSWTTESLSKAVLSALTLRIPAILSESGAVGAAELVARIAQNFQQLGDVTVSLSGIVSRDEARREAVIFFSFKDSLIAPRCLSLAVQIVDRLTRSDVDLERLLQMIESCEETIEANALEPRTREMIEAAERQGIPWFRTNGFMRHVQLGQGFRQKRFWQTMFSDETAFARDYASSKLLTLNTLSQIMLPVGKFAGVKDIASALKAAEGIGYPLVLKPITGGKGDSVYVDLRNEEELKAALVAARVNERPYLLQSFFEGNDYRILVVGDAVVMAEQRIPAAVTGDGKHAVAELVEIENRSPERTGDNTMSSIVLDWESDRMLARQDCTRETILATGRIVRLKGMANVAKGGTSMTVTDIHPDNVRLAIRAARAIGLVVTGVDLICPDISKSWREVGGGICELNTTVGLPHERMTPGNDLRQAIVRAFFPGRNDGRIPTAMVTGTSGKTTVMMLASILAAAGHTVGTATAESVTIGEEEVAQGNFAGADGASIVLRDATVTAAVLETSRGRLITTGTYLDRCDVSALLNVAGEPMDSLDTAAPERKVLDAARKAVVLNADDPKCLALGPEFAGKVRSVLFSGSADAPALRDHLTRGHDAFFLAAHEGHETVMAASGSHTRALLRTVDLPTPPDGPAGHHASAAMAAAALGIGLGIDLDTIRAGLMRYARAGDVLAARLPA